MLRYALKENNFRHKTWYKSVIIYTMLDLVYHKYMYTER